MDVYATQIVELKKEYDEIRKMEAKRQQTREKNRQKERDAKDDDDSDRDAERARRRAAAKADRQSKSEIGNRTDELKVMFGGHEEAAKNLQNWLNERGIGGGFDFPSYAKQLMTYFEKRGVKGTSHSSSAAFNAAADFKFNASDADPNVIMNAVQYDLACLRAAGVDPDAEKPVPERYLQYRTFFQYYEALDYYRRTTGGFKTAANDSATQFELKKREKRLKTLSENMDRLLKKNDAAFARKMDLNGLMDRIDRHIKTKAFRDKNSFEDRMETFSKTGTISSPKTSGDTLESYMDKNRKIFVNKQSKAQKDDSITGLYKEQLDILDGVAASLRTDKFQIIRSGSYSQKKTTRRKKQDDVSLKEPSPYAVYFSDKISKNDIDRVNQQGTPAAASAAANHESSAVSVSEQGKFNQDRTAFRKQYIDLKNLLTKGLSKEEIAILKKTFSPEEAQLFDALTEKKCKGGKMEEDAAAEAFLAIRNLENQGEIELSKEEIENIRNAMEEHKEMQSEKTAEPSAGGSKGGETDWE